MLIYWTNEYYWENLKRWCIKQWPVKAVLIRKPEKASPQRSENFLYLKDKKESACEDTGEALSTQREQAWLSLTVSIIGASHFTDDAPKAWSSEATCPRVNADFLWERTFRPITSGSWRECSSPFKFLATLVQTLMIPPLDNFSWLLMGHSASTPTSSHTPSSNPLHLLYWRWPEFYF